MTTLDTLIQVVSGGAWGLIAGVLIITVLYALTVAQHFRRPKPRTEITEIKIDMSRVGTMSPEEARAHLEKIKQEIANRRRPNV